MKQCRLCPVSCGADRNEKAGACGVKGLRVAKYYLHPFEEPPVSHKNGSGTVFFSGCNLRCVFCQNYEVSRAQRGKEITPAQLCDIFRELELMGADNINLVTPDHVSDLIAEALALYRPNVPVVYNSSGYCKVSALEAIDPFIDVYLPNAIRAGKTISTASRKPSLLWQKSPSVGATTENCFREFSQGTSCSRCARPIP